MVIATLIGGPTVHLAYAGLAFLTDPTFSPPGEYGGLVKTAGPALKPEALGHISIVLLSHDHHPDNLDDAGRAMLPSAGYVLSTPAAAERIPRVIGLKPWHSVTAFGTSGPVTITAVPAEHGPPGVAEHTGPVTGFVIEARDWPTLYFSGDNSEVDVVREIAHRFPSVGLAVLCAGAARVANRGPAPLTLDAERARDVSHIWPDAAIVPVHVDDWAHFSEPREDFITGWAGDFARLALLERGVPQRLTPGNAQRAGR